MYCFRPSEHYISKSQIKMNANQLRIPKTLHFADEISHLNSNFISVNSYNQNPTSTSTSTSTLANPRSINKFINSTPKLPLAVNQNSNSLIYDIIDLYLLPDTAPEELDRKTLSANDKHNVQPALFASLHKGYHYFFGNDYLPSTCNSVNDENTRVVLDMNMNMNDANTAIYHDENIETQSINMWFKNKSAGFFHKLKSFGHRSSSTTTNRTNFKAGETVDEKLKSLFSETTIEENNLKEIVEQRPKRRVTIQEKEDIIFPNYYERKSPTRFRRNITRKLSSFRRSNI